MTSKEAMNKDEAKEKLKAGHKLTHPTFSDDEYIHIENGVLKDEKGYHMHDFWAYRQHKNFDINWSIKENH